jgi:hypothetical protein
MALAGTRTTLRRIRGSRGVRWTTRVIGMILIVTGLVGIPSLPDDLDRWPPLIQSIWEWVGPRLGDIARWIAVGVGLLLLWGTRSRTSQVSPAPLVAEDAGAKSAEPELFVTLESSRWLPHGFDLGAFAMTNDDLDSAFILAEPDLRTTLAPDVVVEFSRLVVPVGPGGPPQVDFYGWSDLADRGHCVSILEDGSVIGQGHIEKRLIATDEPPPWRLDTTWPELVRHSWYRASGRSELGDYGVLTYGSHSMPEADGWGRWSICYGRERDESPVLCFRFHNGTLERDPAGRIEPFHWG